MELFAIDFAPVFDGTASIGLYLSFAVFVLIGVSVLFGIIHGLRRGFGKSVVRLITVIVAAVLSYVALIWALGFLDGWFAGKTVSDMIAFFSPDYRAGLDEGTLAMIDSIDAATAERIIMVVAVLVVTPILFIVLFYLIKAILMIVYVILAAILGFGGKRKSLFSILGGGLVGAVQGIFIAIVVLLPLSGFAGLAYDMRDDLTSSDRPQETVEAVDGFYTSYIDEFVGNPALMTIRQCGGDVLFEMIATVAVSGEEIHMRAEAEAMVEIFVDGMPLANDFKWDRLTPTHKDALRNILADVGEDKYTANIIAGLLRSLAGISGKDALDLGIEDPFDDFVAEFIAIFESSDKENVTKDLGTFLEVYFILNDAGVLTSFAPTEGESSGEEADVKDLLVADDGNGTVISKVIAKLSENPRTAPIVTSLTKFSLKLIADSVGNSLPEGVDSEQIYEDVKSGMNNVLAEVNNPDATPEEKKENVKTSINDALVSSGVLTEETPLDEDIMDSIADYVIQEYDGKEELTDEDINNTILHYYEAYANGELTLPEGTEIPDGTVTP